MRFNSLILGLSLLLLAACAKENDSLASACDIYGASGGALPAAVAGGLRIHDASIVEGDVGSKQMTFWVSLDAPYSADVTFEYTSSDGNAVAGADYEAVSGSGLIVAGSLRTSFAVNIFGDTDAHLTGNENDEYFLVTLSNVSSNVTKIGLPYAAGIIENDEGFTKYQAAVITAAPDYSSGAHSLVSIVNGDSLVTINNIAASYSDMGIASHGQKLFRIERGTGANLVKFDRNCSLAKEAWVYGARDQGDTASNTNPQNLIVLNPSKAYLTRYSQPTVWIVNPSATRPEQFKIGELDLSAYADEDGIPEIHNGVVVGNKLFLTIQRLSRNNGWLPENVAYVAVFDTTTDKEIDTDLVNPGLLGVPLTIRNPNNDIVYKAASNEVYVQGVGHYTSALYPGGVEAINASTYASRVVVNDTGSAHGKTGAMALVSNTKGYIIGIGTEPGDWGNNNLYPFDPSGGTLSPVVTGFNNIDISDISVDPQGRLWVSEGGIAPKLHVINSSDDTLIGTVELKFNPGQVVFFSP